MTSKFLAPFLISSSILPRPTELQEQRSAPFGGLVFVPPGSLSDTNSNPGIFNKFECKEPEYV